jgi:hypothetical protein
MMRCAKVLALLGGALALSAPAAAQDSPAAKATRKKLQQKISVEWKDIGVKVITEDIKREMDKPVAFKIDNVSGVSNNSKLTYKADNKTVEEILNHLSDKGDFGWFVKSEPKDRYDGFVFIRKYKDKERGYEAGKNPVKGMSLERRRLEDLGTAILRSRGGAP